MGHWGRKSRVAPALQGGWQGHSSGHRILCGVCHPDCSGEAVLCLCSRCLPGEGVVGAEPTTDPCDVPCPGTGSPPRPSPGHWVTYVDLSSVEPVLVDDPGNEAKASEPGSAPARAERGEGGERGSCQSPTALSACPGPKGTSGPGFWAGTGGQAGGTAKGRACHRRTPEQDPQMATAPSVTNASTDACAGRELPLTHPSRLQ